MLIADELTELRDCNDQLMKTIKEIKEELKNHSNEIEIVKGESKEHGSRLGEHSERMDKLEEQLEGINKELQVIQASMLPEMDVMSLGDETCPSEPAESGIASQLSGEESKKLQDMEETLNQKVGDVKNVQGKLKALTQDMNRQMSGVKKKLDDTETELQSLAVQLGEINKIYAQNNTGGGTLVVCTHNYSREILLCGKRIENMYGSGQGVVNFYAKNSKQCCLLVL